MIFEHSSKHKMVLLMAFLVILALGVFIIFYSSIIFQEGNPWPQIKGIAQLTFSHQDVVKLDIGENKYITKSDNPEIIKSFMKERGYEFTEQMGAGYLFESDAGTSAVAVHRYYSRYYSLWSISENLTTKDNTLADELKECLPKSDMGSFERCKELLAKIVNFDDCVKAGFPIMETYPLQCATLDGRNFTDESNGDWNMALTVLENCEVARVFQNHSKLVKLKLKNGDELVVYEPQIDEVMEVVENLDGKCGDIILGTE
ncbi:MAG TPA: hypothetical protein PLR18_02155 [bacterium]|nr:hypothetical protein [bacterium]